jgi:two-component system sensor histidine kinase BaeS
VTRSLRGRLALALGLTAALSLAAAAVITFGLVRRYADDQATSELARTARAVAAQAGEDLVLRPARFEQLQRFLVASGNLLATVGPAGRLRADTDEARAVANAIDVRPVLAGTTLRGFVEVGDTRYAYVVIPGKVARAGAVRPLLAGVVLAKSAGSGWAPILSRVLIAAGIAALVASLIAALWARRLARPVQQVASATSRVAAGDLQTRVPVEGSDELADLARSFNAMASALDEARRREGEFLANVSHELRTPITAIRGYIEAIEEGAVRGASGRAEALGVIKTETARLERLVADVTDLARLGTQQFRLAMADTDLASVLRDAASAHPGSAPRVEVAVDGTLRCHTDPDRVRQVIANLVENALRVTPAGGTVRISGRMGDGWVLIDVSDTGPGISAEHLPHVFERAYLRNVGAVDPPVAADGRLAGGSGLGLAIVRELVRALGGRVDVASEIGRGTTFRVALPVR